MTFLGHFLRVSLLALALLLPFERIPSLELYGLTVRLSSVVVAAFILYGLPALVYFKKISPLSWIDRAILIFLAAMSISLVDAIDPSRGLLTFLLLLFVGAGYLLVSRAARLERLRTQAMDWVIIAGLLSAIFGLWQFFGDAAGLPTSLTGLSDRYTGAVFGFARIQSVGVEPLYYASFLLLPIFVLSGRYLFDETVKRRSLLVLGLLTLALVLTLSRGAFLAGLAGLIVMTTAAVYRRVSWQRLLTVLLTVVAGIAGALVCIGAVSGWSGVNRFSQQSTVIDAPVQSSTASRLDHFRQAWGLFRDNPINGVGLGGYDAASLLPDTPEEQGRQIVNNQYLETLAETGLIGLAALVLLGLLAIGKLWRLLNQRPDPLAVALLAALVGLIVQYNFFSTIYILYAWVLLGLIDSLPNGSQST
ncbi:MAG: O-antigen ligase family protein [Patescibacteria group bacterium]